MSCVRTDLAIIGAGPAGLYAAFEAGRHGMSAHIVDVLARPGGQCTELYPEKPIFDIPALVSCTGEELTRNLLAQIERFKPTFHLGVTAVGLDRDRPSERWALRLSNGAVLDAGAVTIAAGAGSFEPRRLEVPGAQRFEGTSLLYSVPDVEPLRGKRVVVVGGGDALNEALRSIPNLRAAHIVVAAGKAERGLRRGLLTEVIEQDLHSLEDWHAQLYGSPFAIDATVQLLRRLGIAEDRLHADPYHPFGN